MYDTLRSVQTPEGIALRLAVAGPVSRALAWLLDLLIRIGIIFVLSMTLGWAGAFGVGLFLLAVFLVEWFYPVLFEVYRNGQTPGKSAMGLRVLYDDGTPIGWSGSMVRNLLRAVDFLPLFNGFGLITMLLSSDFKRLGDIVAGTVVVYADKPGKRPALPDIPPSSPAYALSLDEQQALLSFAERTAQLTEERAEELAALTGPLVEKEQRPLHTLLGVANWIAGKRT